MQERIILGQVYTCPMHTSVRQEGPGRCPKCGMALMPEGTRFGLFRHIISSPVHVVLMVAVMIALTAAIMLMR
jgi:heavy metal-binding protein